MATDPVCGMYVDNRTTSLTSDRQSKKYYFCSNNCKIPFERPKKEMKAIKMALIVSIPLTVAVALNTFVFPAPYHYIMFILASIASIMPLECRISLPGAFLLVWVTFSTFSWGQKS